MKQLCRVHAAFITLRQQFRKYKAVTEKFEQTRKGRKPKLGTKNTQRYSKQLRSPALAAAIKKYDLAVKNYADTFNPKNVPEFAVSVEALQAKDDEDIFWDDMVFDIKEADWSRNQDCRQGIKFMLMRDRAVEEKARLQAETARLIRWCHDRHNIIEECISKIKSKMTVPSSSNSTADCNDVNLFFLEETKERHAALEEQRIGDGLWRVWDKRPEPCLEDEGVEDILIMLRERVGIRWGFETTGMDGNPSLDEVYVEKDREIVEVDVSETDGEERTDDREDVGAGKLPGCFVHFLSADILED
ncbi:hypothetical protein CNA02125 [Cryptococcus deneoformans JEC21]|uniref:Uncharacterized protein n=1 Tax=Cryptococcus deneoformans (strain JEC21 / ATCC MYA-565) TaxID=214684 RepID=A0A0S2LIK6_CRYD1|nr:hypothetical protein CNA02125 [Cryptococcus neoformans var. neoformans JEC21]ALO60300.1 hypothetical protein CNA02125 [Cryptococcus neoformans var. neoformans JEC21]